MRWTVLALVLVGAPARGEEKTVADLVEAVRSEEWYTRWDACLKLQAAGAKAKAAIPALAKVAVDPEADVSREACLALAAIAPRDPRSVAAFVAVLKGEGDKAAALYGLAQAGDAAMNAMSAVLRVLRDDDGKLHQHGMRALLAIAPVKRVRAEVARLLREEADHTCSSLRALESLGRDARATIPQVFELLTDDVHHRQARRTLYAIGGGALASLVRVKRVTPTTYRGGEKLETESDRIESDLPGWPEEWRALRDLLTDVEIGEDTRRLLGALRPKRVPIRELVERTRDADAVTRECSALLLGIWEDPGAKPDRKALDALRGARLDMSPRVRVAATWALERLESD